ncbi:glycoside hydrolase [Dentipellis sp. KUC8613]|nr:glycoside hydrolase [Dentipellis sp. KUC8613]
MAGSHMFRFLISLFLFWGTLALAAGSTTKPVIVQMFEWTWDSIATECTQFLGPAGYGYVQASPAQEHIQGTQWYTDYQPVSYNLTSKRGDRCAFVNMIGACHAAGVQVIADAVFNHMTGLDSGTGVGGSPFTHYQYPIYQNSDFHHCTLEPDGNIHNYANRQEVQTCQLLGLADLATETENVRARLATYANDLLSIGIDGLRLDAAKHIAASDLSNILSRLTKAPYITAEVIYGAGEAVQPSEYTGLGDVQEFRYTSTLQSAFLGNQNSISSLQNLDNRGWIAGTGANVFVANHDTERNGNSLNYQSPSNTYLNAQIFSLAHPYGRPTILSSYMFATTDDGAPNMGIGTCSSQGGANGWLCQHRYPGIVGMVGFRNTVGAAALNNWVSPNSQQIAFGRGTAGFVAINNADSVWTATFKSSLPDGSYCDVAKGPKVNGACAAASYTVSQGSFMATVPARSSMALHIGALTPTSCPSSSTSSGFTTMTTSSTMSSTTTSSATTTTSAAPPSGSVFVTFIEQATTSGEGIYVVGSIQQLGNWAPSNAIALTPSPSPTWVVRTTLPANTNFEYKFIRKFSNGQVQWESDPNRNYRTPASGSVTLSSSFK